MGQKVHPAGLRLGINRTWDSRWFARRDYQSLTRTGRNEVFRFPEHRWLQT